MTLIFRNRVYSGPNGLAVHQIVVGEPNQGHVVKIEKNLNVGVVFVPMLASGVTGDNLSNHVPKVFYFLYKFFYRKHYSIKYFKFVVDTSFVSVIV